MKDKNLLTKIIILVLIVLIIILVVWFLLNKNNWQKEFLSASVLTPNLTNNENLMSTEIQNAEAMKPFRDWSIDELEINAKAAIVVETNSIAKDKILFRKNEKQKLPIASLTKLMTALVVLKNYDLKENVVISNEAVNQEGDQGFLKPGEKLSIENLLYIMLIESSNDASYALAELKGINNFVDLMNLGAKNLGLFDTQFIDAAGLSPDNYSTAADLVKLTKYLLKNYPLIWEIVSLPSYKLYTPEGIFHHELINTNELLEKIPDIIGGKTGKTTEAKGCLLLVLKNHGEGNNLIYIILGSDSRFKEMKKLIEWVNIAYQW